MKKSCYYTALSCFCINRFLILLTGSLAYSKLLTEWIKDRVQFIAPVVLYPGENEMLALAESGMRWLTGEEDLKTY